MAKSTTSTHRAQVTIPVSGNPAERVDVVVDVNGRVVGFSATSTASPEEALSRIVKFLEDALAEARKP